MGVGDQRYAPAAFTPGKYPVLIVQEAWWAPGLVWIGAENLAPTGIRSPDLPACSYSLYRLSYPGPRLLVLRHSKSRCRWRQIHLYMYRIYFAKRRWALSTGYFRHLCYYESRSESKERLAIQRYLLIIGKKQNMQVLSHTFNYFST